MSLPLVSVIIPARDRLLFLIEALDSVAGQTYQNYEVIVVDDGSTQPLGTHVEGHGVRPRVIRQATAGPGAARNRGLREARGELIAFLDSDDLWLPEKLSKMVTALESRPDIDIFYGPMIAMDENGATVEGHSKPRHGGWIAQELFQSCFVDVPTVVCRRELLAAAGGFDETLCVCEDYDLWLRLSVTHEFGFVAEPSARRRLHGNRLSKVKMRRNLAVKANMLRRFWENHAGSGRIDAGVAKERLSRVFFVAGRSALRAGEFRDAAAMFRTSREYGRAPWRTGPLSLIAAACSGFSRGESGENKSHSMKKNGALVKQDA